MLGLSNQERMKRLSEKLGIVYTKEMHEAYKNNLVENGLKVKSVEHVARREYSRFGSKTTNTAIVREYISAYRDICKQFGFDDVKGGAEFTCNSLGDYSAHNSNLFSNKTFQLSFTNGRKKYNKIIGIG